jgi:hypothetical protein
MMLGFRIHAIFEISEARHPGIGDAHKNGITVSPYETSV